MSKRAYEATLSGRPSDPRLAEAQRLHHEERRFQAQAKDVDQQRSDAWKETQELQIQKATQDANVKALGESVDKSRSELFQARDKLAAIERDAKSLEIKDPKKAVDLREDAAQLRSSIHDLEQVAGQNDARLTAAWDDVKATEAKIEARSADVERLQSETARLRGLAEERETAAESLEAQRAAEPMRSDVPDVEILPDNVDKLHKALLDGHKVGLGADGGVHVMEERGAPMTPEAAAYLETKLPELRHRMGEDWNFSIDPNGNIVGNGPGAATYFAQPDGKLSENTLAEVRARIQSGENLSVGPDGTVVTSPPAEPITHDQAMANLAAFNKEVSSGHLDGQLAEGRGFDLKPDGSTTYVDPVPLTSKVTDPAQTAVPPADDPAAAKPAEPDAGANAGTTPDADTSGTTPDAGTPPATGATPDTGTTTDAGATGTTSDAATDGGTAPDAGTAPESATTPVSGAPDDLVGDESGSSETAPSTSVDSFDGGSSSTEGSSTDGSLPPDQQPFTSDGQTDGETDDAFDSAAQSTSFESDGTWDNQQSFESESAATMADAPADDELDDSAGELT